MHPNIEKSLGELVRSFNTKAKNGIEDLKKLLPEDANVAKEIAEFFIQQK